MPDVRSRTPPPRADAGAAPACGGERLRVAIVFGQDHLDHDLAFAAIVAHHADVLICAPTTTPASALAEVEAREHALFAWPRHRQALANLRLLKGVSDRIKAFRPQVVHVLSEGQVWLNLLPAFIRPLPMVVTLHDVDPHPGDRDTLKVPRALVNLFVRQADAVLVHGEGLKARARTRLGLEPGRVFVGVHPPIGRYAEMAREAGFAKPADGVFRMLFFGRVFAYKGVRFLVAAEPMIAADVVPRRVVIAGRGELDADVLAAVASSDRFDLRLHRIEDLEAARLFTEADLLVAPYVEASQSGVLAIAAAFGLPVVASDVGEIGRLVRTTGMGRVVPPADPQALAEAITGLARDPGELDRHAQNARRALDTTLGAEAVWTAARRAYHHAARPDLRGA